jgi:hypothetical protein
MRIRSGQPVAHSTIQYPRRPRTNKVLKMKPCGPFIGRQSSIMIEIRGHTRDNGSWIWSPNNQSSMWMV